MPGYGVDQIPGHGYDGKEHQRSFPPVAITYPSAGVLIKAVKQVFQRREHSDDNAARTKRHQVFRQIALPQFFTQSEPENAQRQDCDVAVQTKVFAQ